MNSIQINTPAQSGQYDISFHDDFNLLAAALKKQIVDRRFVLVTDTNVNDKTSFLKDHLKPSAEQLVVLKPGETEKKWSSIDQILTTCFEAGLDRGSVIVRLAAVSLVIWLALRPVFLCVASLLFKYQPRCWVWLMPVLEARRALIVNTAKI